MGNLNDALRPCGYQKLTVSTTAVALTLPTASVGKGRKPRFAMLKVETNPVRYRDDADPTATDGILMAIADPAFLYQGDLGTLKFIRQGGADGTLHVLYYA
jgi:hypothetical protein